jgi:hypothetical protein
MPFPTYDKKDAIPAGAEDVYEEKEGKWVPVTPDVSGLKTALDAERVKLRSTEKTVNEVAKLKDAAEREVQALKAQIGDPEGKTAQLLKKFDEDVAKATADATKRAEAAEAKVRALTLDDAAKKAFIDAGGRAEKADAVLKLYKDRLDLSEDRPVVKDDKGNVTTRALVDFFKEDVKKEQPEFYTGTKAGGGGASGINGGMAGTGTAPTFEELMANPGRALEAANAAPAKAP